MRVLVTDANASAAVATVRSLGRRGVECEVAWQGTAFPIAATSRFCDGVVRLPDPMAAPDAYAEALLRHVRRGDFDAVIPISDGARAACAPERGSFERRATYVAAPEAASRAAEDKWGILEQGRAAGLATPPARLVEREADWTDAREALAVPLVLRSRRSLIRNGDRFRKPPTRVHFDPAAADADARARCARGEPFVVTRFREGTGRGVYLFLSGGAAICAFGHFRLRETNPQGSAACAAVPLVPTAEEVERCAALARALGLDGAAMLEFRTGRQGEPEWLVEINPRLWGSIQLAVDAGFDFPWWQLRWFAFGEAPARPAGTGAVRGARFLTAELVHLLHAAKGRPAGWGGRYPTWRESWRAFLEAFGPGWRAYHQRAGDPLPGLVEPLMFVPFGWVGGPR